MKKYGKIIAVAVLLAAAAVFVFNNGKTRNEIAGQLGREMGLENEDITFAGEICDEKDCLLWFTRDSEGAVGYRAVACRKTGRDKYKMKEVYKPSVYAKDIVSVVWKGEAAYLVNNPDCRSFITKDEKGNIISEIYFSPEDIPRAFCHTPPEGRSTSDFYDTEGNIKK